MVYSLYPAVDNATYQFPPVIRAALAESPELHHLVIPMPEIDRNELIGADLWNGRLIFNTTSNKINYYNSQTLLWYEIDLDKLSLDGGSLFGPLTLAGAPSLADHAANKQYVDDKDLARKSYVDAAIPIGSIITFGAATAPSGWHLCNGTAHGSSALQSVIGSANTPDLRDRFIVAAGSTYAQGNTGGAASVTLTAAQSGLPDHNHVLAMGGTPAVGNTLDTPMRSTGGGDGGFRTQGVSMSSTYGTGPYGAQNASASHENRPPYHALTYIIKKA